MAVIMSKQMVIPSTGQLISDYSVGESVFLNVNGSPTEFLIVHQGNPNTSIYDSSCDGTWLLMKDCYENKAWNSTKDKDYANSTINTYLNGTFLELFDVKVQSAIKQVKIPYRVGSGYGTTVANGSNGLSTKVFLLSGAEVSIAHGDLPTNEGAELLYFEGCKDEDSDSRRIAKLNGSAVEWYLRSPSTSFGDTGTVWSIATDGDILLRNNAMTSAYGIRPALILPYNAKFDVDTNEFKGVE